MIPLPWWAGRMLAFDLETTHKQPELARIVQYGLAWVGGGEPPVRHSAIVDPGVEIPEEAAGVHGITTERARSEGVPEVDASDFIVEQLLMAAARKVPVVIFNARYDLTVMDRRMREHAGEGMPDELWPYLRVVDPFVLDKWLDRYRRSYPYGHTPETAAAAGVPSSRTLEGMALHYGAELDKAHDAASDAITGARIAYRIGQRGEVIRRKNDREAQEARTMWAEARGDLDELHAVQHVIAVAERQRFAEYKREQAVELSRNEGATEGQIEQALADVARIESERGWPVLEVMAHEVNECA